MRTLTLHLTILCGLYNEAFWKVFAHCYSTLPCANSKVERFAVFVRDQEPRSSEKDEALIKTEHSERAKTRPTAASEPSRLRKGVCCVLIVRLAPMKTVVCSADTRAQFLC